MTPPKLGPDSARYWLAAAGTPVARPFHLRWLLPKLCGQHVARWWVTWAVSWPLIVGGVAVMASHRGAADGTAFAAGLLCAALPGLWGPRVVRPVGVDLPAVAVSVWAVVAADAGWWWAAVPLVLVAGAVKESSPIFAALWAWHPLLLVGLAAPLVRALVARPELDEVTAMPTLREVHDHPVRTALGGRQWRSAWVMVAPWGVCLAALLGAPWSLWAVLAVAYAQLFVATDTVRLVHAAAGPPMAVAAALAIPAEWLPLAVVVHAFWWWQMEVV